jgi:bifunctional DNA primase/polymerase-like protein
LAPKNPNRHYGAKVNLLKNEALALSAKGIWVFTTQPNSKIPFKGSRGLLDATTDPNQIHKMYERRPNANLAIDCGRSGIAVVDWDKKNDPDGVALKALADVVGHDDLYNTRITNTPSGGMHFPFLLPEGLAVPSGNNRLGKGLDVKSDGGYVLVSPSKLPHGQYRLHNGISEISPIPTKLLKLLTNGKSEKKFDKRRALNGVPKGERQENLFKLYASLCRARVPLDAAQKVVAAAAATYKPPFTGDTDKLGERVYEKYAAQITTDSPYYAEGTDYYRSVIQGKNLIPRRISKGIINIVADQQRDDGAEVTRQYLLRGMNEHLVIQATIPASHLNSRNLDEWLPNLFGPKFIVEVNEIQHFIAAIKHQSPNPDELRILTRSGWLDDRYLNTSYLDVELLSQLKPLNIPTPLTGANRVPSIRAALNLLTLGRPEVVYPALAAPFRAVLGIVPDFAMAFVGRTGIFKSALAVLVQQFFGAGFDWEHIPGSWASTANQIELLGFHAKDAVFVVDEFKPSGSDRTRAQHYADLDRIVRGTANRSARGRLDAKLNIRVAKPMRCLLVITAEEGAIGESLVGRIFTIEMKSGDIASANLTKAQADAKAGLYVAAMSGFIDWMKPQVVAVQANARESFERYRQEAQRPGLHARTPGIIAQLYTGLEFFIEYARDANALNASEARDLLAKGWQALNDAGSKTQAASLRAADPVEMFYVNVRAALSSGNAHIASTVGKAPSLGAGLDFRAACGWRERPTFGDWESHGDCIGWIDADKTGRVQIYLDPISSYKAAQRMAVGVEQKIPIAEKTLRRHLKDAKRLTKWDAKHETTTARKSICGVQKDVLWVKTEDVLGPDPEPAPDVDKMFEEACTADTANQVSM